MPFNNISKGSEFISKREVCTPNRSSMKRKFCNNNNNKQNRT